MFLSFIFRPIYLCYFKINTFFNSIIYVKSICLPGCCTKTQIILVFRSRFTQRVGVLKQQKYSEYEIDDALYRSLCEHTYLHKGFVMNLWILPLPFVALVFAIFTSCGLKNCKQQEKTDV